MIEFIDHSMAINKIQNRWSEVLLNGWLNTLRITRFYSVFTTDLANFRPENSFMYSKPFRRTVGVNIIKLHSLFTWFPFASIADRSPELTKVFANRLEANMFCRTQLFWIESDFDSTSHIQLNVPQNGDSFSPPILWRFSAVIRPLIPTY